MRQDLKITFVDMIVVLGKKINKSLKETHEKTNQQWKEMNETVQDQKVEKESMKKTQAEQNLETKKFRNSISNPRVSHCQCFQQSSWSKNSLRKTSRYPIYKQQIN